MPHTQVQFANKYFFFPARGAIHYGEIEHVDYKQLNLGGGFYNIISIFGKGMVEVYQKQNNKIGLVQ